MNAFKRVILLVLDSVGIGALPDAEAYGDLGANTLGHIDEAVGLPLPNLAKLGLAKLHDFKHIPAVEATTGVYGKAMESSKGKDTITGHWELAGVITEKGFPTYWHGFSKELIADFEAKTGRKVLGNKVASGTEILKELGEEHLKTGDLIVYTSADSVLQIAAHEEKVPLAELYKYCEIARELSDVARIIARPFLGTCAEDFHRTANRKDFAVLPPETMLDRLKAGGKEVKAVGKIVDIFCGQGITHYQKTKNNQDGIDKTIEILKADFSGLIFTNLVDFDSEFGHRRDVKGYQNCLVEFDKRLPEILATMQADDLLIITADHGNDPIFKGTDHTREYVPILCWHKNIQSKPLGVRNSFTDFAATIEQALLHTANDKSFLNHIA